MADRRRSIKPLVLAVALATAVSGCGGGGGFSDDQGQGNERAAEEPIRFGALLTLTGSLSAVGNKLKSTVEFAVDEINQDGGVRALDGAELEPVFGDSQTDPNEGVSETQRLIDEGVVAVIDQYPSSISIAASTVAERMKTPYIAAISYADDLSNRGYSYLFQQQVPAAGIAQEKVDFLDYLNEKADEAFERVAVVYENTDYGTSIGENTIALLDERDYELVADISYPATSSSYDTQMSQLEAADPDVVLLVPYLNDQILWARTAELFDMDDIPWVGNSLKLEPDFEDAVGEIPEYELDRNIWSADLSAESAELAQRFKEATDFDLSGNYALMYQAVYTLRAAIEEAGSSDRDAIRDALAGLKLEPGPDLFMPWDGVEFNDAGVNELGHGIVSQYLDGEWTTVWPPERASTEPRLDPRWE